MDENYYKKPLYIKKGFGAGLGWNYGSREIVLNCSYPHDLERSDHALRSWVEMQVRREYACQFFNDGLDPDKTERLEEVRRSIS